MSLGHRGDATCGRFEGIRVAEERAIMEYNMKKTVDAQGMYVWRQAHFGSVGGSVTSAAASSDPGASWGRLGQHLGSTGNSVTYTSTAASAGVMPPLMPPPMPPRPPMLAIMATPEESEASTQSAGSAGSHPHAIWPAPAASEGSASSPSGQAPRGP